jgi:hypothetical protein
MTEGNWAVAVCMWRTGKDTIAIAEWFGVKEAFIYNRLYKYNYKWKGQSVRLMGAA